MAMLKMCPICKRLIPQTRKYCEQCEAAEQGSRHTKYNKTRRDPRTAAFYVSPEWRRLRTIIITAFDGVDIWALYKHRQLLSCDHVHHIIELEEDWTRRLDPLNLIPLNIRTHSEISQLYAKGPAVMRATQQEIYSLIDRHFGGPGEYSKVLQRLGVVASPSISEKTPHGKFRY